VIAISQAAAEEIELHYRVPRDRIRVVHLGVAEEWFQEAPAAAARAESALLPELQPGYFLFVGTLQPRKNVATLLQAYDRLDPRIRAERQLVIAGRYGWGAEPLRRELERRRADKRVLWLDYVDQDALRRLYREAAAFIFPSLAEGFGLPVLEALASGVPVVASDLPAVREAANDHAIFTSPHDPDALADAMRCALSVDRSAPADAGRRAWARRFDWRTCAQRTCAVYREVA
jgi:glycosyltransferase involved in cell wall biosynthesis